MILLAQAVVATKAHFNCGSDTLNKIVLTPCNVVINKIESKDLLGGLMDGEESYFHNQGVPMVVSSKSFSHSEVEGGVHNDDDACGGGNELTNQERVAKDYQK
jgi:hypothetical protein